MFRAIKSSWWIHLPGLLAIAGMIALMLQRRPWPPRVPVHFDLHWQPNRWGSPWEISIFPILAGGILLAEFITSAVWSRHEEGKKRFNVVLPLIAAPLGAIVGVHGWFWWNLRPLAESGSAPGGWAWTTLCALILASLSIALEIFRKPLPEETENLTAAEESTRHGIA